MFLCASCLSNDMSNRKLYVSLVGTLVTTILNAFVLTPAVQIC